MQARTYFVTCFLIHYFFIWFFSWIRKQIFWQVDLKIHVWLSLYKDHFKKTYLEPWMLYDITDGRSFHCIDLEHLSDQVCYWRIFYMFWCFVNPSFDLQNKSYCDLIKKICIPTFWNSLFVLSSSKGSVPQSKA